MRVIYVENYNPQWAKDFHQLYDHIWKHVSTWANSLEHVGSTSVPELAAKPIIDMTIVVSNKENLAIVIENLQKLGYQHRGDLGVTGREAFSRLEGFPPHNLYACIEGNIHLYNHLTLRDHLRNNSKARKEYSQLKQSLAKKYPHDIDSYVAGKTDWILGVLQQYSFADTDLNNIHKINKQDSQA